MRSLIPCLAALALALPASASAQALSSAPSVALPPSVQILPPGSLSAAAPLPAAPLPAPPVPESVASNPVSAPSLPGSTQAPAPAAAQGFVDPAAQARLRQALEDIQAMNSARQRGAVVPAPTLANPVAVSPAEREWLLNWEFVLTTLGMDKHKVRFEASRLDRAQFQAWASRQYRFRQPMHVRVEVLGRPVPAPALPLAVPAPTACPCQDQP